MPGRRPRQQRGLWWQLLRR